MLYNILTSYSDTYSFLNFFNFLTVRTGLAVITAMIIVFLIGDRFINFFSSKQITNPIRSDGPEDHLIKKIGTPTMGGVLILIGLFTGVFLWADLLNPYNWLLIFITLSFGILGAFDDYKKIKNNNSNGISSKLKILIQIFLCLISLIIFYKFIDSDIKTNLYFPFFKNLVINLGWFFIPFYLFVIVGSSNAVNLTDGLDGLATVPVILVAGCFGFISYVSGNVIFADYLLIPYIEGVGEVAVFCGAIIGASVGVVTKHEIVLAITGGLFVLEAISVIVQVVSFKLTGKRIFMMAPIHHHFEKKGWAESTIVIRFWIISLILAMIGLATLKLR